MTVPEDAITPEQAGNLYGLFLERARRSPDDEAYRHFDSLHNEWCSLNWSQMCDQVGRWQSALAKEGLVKGDRVALMLRNCPQWVMFDQAAMSLGLVVVPLYTVDRAENIAYIVNDSQAKIFLFETAEQWQELSVVHEQLDGVQRFISLDEINCDDCRLVSAAQYLPDSATPQSQVSCDMMDLASIIYTSGTTGKPKGVMLSHSNMLSDAYNTLGTFSLRSNDLLLSFLPLSHAFERTVGYYLAVMTGAKVAYARSIPLLSEDLQSIKPTVLVSVPRIYERVYAAISSKLSAGSSFKQKLFKLTVDIGWDRFLKQQGRGGWRLSFLLWPILNKLVAHKVLDKLGGRLRVAVSGGAALDAQISRMFIALGLPVVQGYGLTETSPIVTGNKLENNFPDSVGQPIHGVQIKLGENDALLVKGPNVMMGYWNNEAATRDMIDGDGWLNTGDIARISETGHVYITGRLKEIIVLANGEKIPPTDMESAIAHDSLFEQVMVYGEGKPYLIGLLVLNPDEWEVFSKQLGVNLDHSESLTDIRVEQQVLQRVDALICNFPGYAKINQVLLLTDPWTIDNGLLTPKLSLKRDSIVTKYAAEIASLYKGH